MSDANAHREQLKIDGSTVTIQDESLFKMCFNVRSQYSGFNPHYSNNDVTEIDDQHSDAYGIICGYLLTEYNQEPGENLKIKFDSKILRHFPNLQSISFYKTRGLELALSDLEGLNNLTKLTIMEARDQSENESKSKSESESESEDSQGVHLVNSNLEELPKISENLKELKFNIVNNELQGTLDSLKSLTKLTKFWFEGCTEEDEVTGVGNSINGDVNQFLKDHPALTDLHITGTDVNGVIKVSSLRDVNSQLCNCYYKLNSEIEEARFENRFELQGFLKENNKGQECIVKNDSDSSEEEKYGEFVDYSASDIEDDIFADVEDIDGLCDSIELYTETDEQKKIENNLITVCSPQVLKFFFNKSSLNDEEISELDDRGLREKIKQYLAYKKGGTAEKDADEELDEEKDYYKTETIFALDSEVLKNFSKLESINFQYFPGFVLDLTAFAGLPNLKKLILNTYVIELTNSALEDVQKISPKLEKLEIGGEISGNLSSLASLTKLKELCLKGQRNGYQGSLADLSNLTNLERLEINGGNVHGNLADLQSLTKLNSLALVKVPDISGSIEDLRVLANLKNLTLEGEITGNIEQFKQQYKEQLKVCNILPVKSVQEGSVNPQTIPSSSDNHGGVGSEVAGASEIADTKQQTAEFIAEHTLQGVQLKPTIMEIEPSTSGQTSEQSSRQSGTMSKRKLSAVSESELQSTSMQEVETDSEEKAQIKRRRLDFSESGQETPMPTEVKGQAVVQSVQHPEIGPIQSNNEGGSVDVEQLRGGSTILKLDVTDNNQIKHS